MDSTPFHRTFRLTWFCCLLGFILALPVNSVLNAADPDYVMMWQGNEWTFEVVIVKAGGSIDKGSMVLKIGDKIVHNGREYLEQHTSMKMSNPYEVKTFIRTDENGFYTIPNDMPDSKEQIQIALPLKIGVAWETKSPTEVTKNKVTGQENVIVNGKTYKDCFHVHIDESGGQMNYWLAPGVGAVKVEGKSNDGDSITMTLLEFKQGGK